MVLPKEHPDLRAFVTQRECFDISEEEFLSYETEVGLAVLIEKEIKVFKECYDEKIELTKLELDAEKIIEIIDEDKEGNLNFKNLRNFFHDSGLLPYDAEIISLLRRVDRDDDGIILPIELEKFLKLFFDPETKRDYEDMKLNKAVKQMDVRRESPGRKIVQNRITLLSSERKILKGPSSSSKPARVIEEGIDPRQSLLRERAEVKQKMKKLEEETLLQKSLHRGYHNESKSGLGSQSNLQSRNSTINLKQYSQDQVSENSLKKLERTIPTLTNEKGSKAWENQTAIPADLKTTDLKRRLNFEKSERADVRLSAAQSSNKEKTSTSQPNEVDRKMTEKMSQSKIEKHQDQMRKSASKFEDLKPTDSQGMMRMSRMKNSASEQLNMDAYIKGKKIDHESSPSTITQESSLAHHRVQVTTEYTKNTVPLRNSIMLRQSYDQPMQTNTQNSQSKAPHVVRVPQRSIDKRSPEKFHINAHPSRASIKSELVETKPRDLSQMARSSSTKDIQETIKSLQKESSKSNLALERSRERMKSGYNQQNIVERELNLDSHKTPTRSSIPVPEGSAGSKHESKPQNEDHRVL